MVNSDEETLRQLTNDIKMTHNKDEKKKLQLKRKNLLKKMKLE